MRFFLILAALFAASPAKADPGWVALTPDHLNLLYAAGEQANFVVRLVQQPLNPAFQLSVTVEQVGVSTPVALQFENGVAIFTSSALVAGVAPFRVLATLKGSATAPDLPWSGVVQDSTWNLNVAPSGF